jgi:uncharacterized protein DUF4232
MIAPPRPPSHDELEALIKEARARQLRRRLVGAASIAIAAAVGLSVYTLTTGGGRRATIAISPVQAPTCRASQLSTSFGLGGATGLALGGLLIGNTAGRSCSLPPGRPIVHVILRGRTLPAKERSWGSDQQFGPRAGHILRPGTRVFFEIGWRGWCPNPAAAPESRHATLLLKFRGGLSLAVPETPPERVVSLPGCGEAVHPTPWIRVSDLLRYR